MSDDEILDELEVDLEVADIGEILEAHGVRPNAELVLALWDWMEALRNIAEARSNG